MTDYQNEVLELHGLEMPELEQSYIGVEAHSSTPVCGWAVGTAIGTIVLITTW